MHTCKEKKRKVTQIVLALPATIANRKECCFVFCTTYRLQLLGGRQLMLKMPFIYYESQLLKQLVRLSFWICTCVPCTCTCMHTAFYVCDHMNQRVYYFITHSRFQARPATLLIPIGFCFCGGGALQYSVPKWLLFLISWGEWFSLPAA